MNKSASGKLWRAALFMWGVSGWCLITIVGIVLLPITVPIAVILTFSAMVAAPFSKKTK